MSRILVVDDSRIMRKIIVRSLNAVGVTDIVEAVDGNEAIDLFGPGSFDMVLISWTMVGKTIYETVQEIRMQDPIVPIVMIVVGAERGRVVRATRAGISDYLIKPFEVDVLREKLEKYDCLLVKECLEEQRMRNWKSTIVSWLKSAWRSRGGETTHEKGSY